MNYELKSVSPGSIFFNAIRIFVIIGFIVALISFFIMPNPNLRITGFFPRLAATALFTVVYGLVISAILTLIAWLYNLWAGKFRGVSVRLESQE